ncbi:carboxylesterase 5A-like [Littorina saxatilis]|uniref:Carboxylesterase type B domain-containing protein n=1 Tax=Littorina saxatilis TaxID=31220 RepID=A0AAN9GB10_9CAEN
MAIHKCALLLLYIVPLCVSEDVVVTTKNGELRGRRVSTGQTSYLDTFLGIPFAAPPVGSLRFAAPQPAKPWTGTRDATRFNNMCSQPPNFGTPSSMPLSEDCLYLNVYAPQRPSDASLLPVMFWIHGGAYKTGTAASYNGTELASKGVVVVTANYRLGALGFLSTLDDECPGNNGLLDQILALKWVKDNIASFHGDSSDVTIFGESAGSASVSLLRLSPLAQGLFSKAIMESGVSTSPWALARPGKDIISPLQFAQSLAKETGCGADVLQTNKSLITCLRQVSVDQILNATETIYKSTSISKFRPTVETVLGVIPDDPLKLLTRGAGSNITSIRGVNKNENSFFFLSYPLLDLTRRKIEAIILHFANEFFPGRSQTVADKIIAEYITSRNLATPEQCRDALVEIRTGFDFIVPTILEQKQTVRKPGHAQQYLYEFTYRATHSTRPAWAGVIHASELPFVFGQPFTHDQFFSHIFAFNWSSEDTKVSMNMITMWTNFAKYGNPTLQSVGGVSWVPYSLDSQSYLDIGSSLSVKANLAPDSVRFWAAILDDAGGLIG